MQPGSGCFSAFSPTRRHTPSPSRRWPSPGTPHKKQPTPQVTGRRGRPGYTGPATETPGTQAGKGHQPPAPEGQAGTPAPGCVCAVRAGPPPTGHLSCDEPLRAALDRWGTQGDLQTAPSAPMAAAGKQQEHRAPVGQAARLQHAHK
uniref:Uncharacterized protein n=1 Tax=Accipiter nisus TaxID=211598 RepID=A0A8B9M438_9AVES